MRYALESTNRMSADEIRAFQEQRLLKQIRYSYDNSAFYRTRFKEVGVEVGDIKSLDDYFQMPILMDKEQERRSQALSVEAEGHPFGAHLCSDPTDVAITATTSGTTGEPTFTYTVGHGDVARLTPGVGYMLSQAGLRPGERILFAHALGVYATSVVLAPLRASGFLPIDVDVRGGAEMILNYAKLTRPSAAMMTPSLAQHMIKRIPEVLGIQPRDLGLKAIFTVGEIGISIPATKEKLESAYGCRVYDWIGPAGQTLAVSCDSDDYHGMHAITPETDLYPLDLVDPTTKRHIPVEDGVEGEAIYTSLNRRTLPILRYASGDIVRVHTDECPGCGFRGPRLKVVGRSDDMLIVKGVNVYPGAIKSIVNEFSPAVTGEIRIVLQSPPPMVDPPLHVKIERSQPLSDDDLPSLEERIKDELHTRLRITPEIHWVDFGELPHALAKTPLFEKNY